MLHVRMSSFSPARGADRSSCALAFFITALGGFSGLGKSSTRAQACGTPRTLRAGTCRWRRDGCCNTGPGDDGLHLICSEVSAEFLQFSALRGNDLSTPNPMFEFPGLKPGDRWCLCALRWKEALEAGAAPAVVLEATHISSLEFVDLEDLQAHAIDPT